MGSPPRGPKPGWVPDNPSSRDDRRKVCRYSVVKDQAWLGWWVEESFVHTPARILDVSLHGARLIVEKVPPLGSDLWFCPPYVDPPEWVEAELVPVEKRIFKSRTVRITFRTVFPYELFKALVYGADVWRACGSKPPVVPDQDGCEG